MKMLQVVYTFKGNKYVQVMYAKNMRTARHKLAVQHKSVVQAIKIIETNEV